MNATKILKMVAEKRLGANDAFQLLKNGHSQESNGKNHPTSGEEIQPEAIPNLSEQKEIPDILYYSSAWKQAPLKAGASNDAMGDILLFDHQTSLRRDLASKLQQQGGGTIVLVMPGSKYEQTDRHTYTICPDQPDDYQQLMEQLRRDNIEPARIVHGWSRMPAQSNSAGLEQGLKEGCIGLYHLFRTLLERAPREPYQLLCMYPVGSGIVQSVHAPLASFVRTLRLEAPQLKLKAVGFEQDALGRPTESDAKKPDVCWAELQDMTGTDIEILYRQDRRYVKSLKPLEPPSSTGRPAVIQKGGVCVITGGAGGLGLIVAEELARRYEFKLVLNGRSGLSESQSKQIEKIRLLGTQVEYVQADISSRDGVERLIAEAEKRFGSINGIIHAAGVIKDALIAKKYPQDFNAVLAPKVFGAFHLDDVTQAMPLDFFILFSAMAGVLGNSGQSDYAYANGFLDLLAHRREAERVQGRRQGRTLSINWPLWAQGGMNLDDEQLKMIRNLAGMIPLSNETGIDVFFRCLDMDQTQVLPLAGNKEKLDRFLSLHDGSVHPISDKRTTVDPIGDSKLGSMVQHDLLVMIGKLMKISTGQINPNHDMADYGFDSIKLTALANRINDRFGLEMTPAIFFELEAPTVSACTKYLVQVHKETLSEYYKKEEETKQPIPFPIEHAASPSPSQQLSSEEPGIEYAPKRLSRFSADGDPMAIIGMAGVMPQSEDLEAFWQHLAAGDHMVTEIPPERWDWRAYYGDPKDDPNKTRIKWGAFMPAVDRFDAGFFGISPREAELMDPQQRLCMQLVWQVIEDAGYCASDLSGSATGLFIGVQHSDYRALLRRAVIKLGAYAATGISPSILVNRISYFLNLTGPSESINTACSSSLVALHRAVESIRNGSCDMAIAGGVNVILNPAAHVAAGGVGFLSEQGQCRTFDQAADGTVRGEGAGVVLIKPLSCAIADGDHICALIRASAENHGGRANSLTAPNANAQANLIVKAYQEADIHPATVGYIEAHGAGTRLGDPIEINGIRKAFKTLNEQQGPTGIDSTGCGIGSVKSNIGHLETAAGIAGILKVLLSMRHKTLPASVNFEILNSHIELDHTPFYIVSATRPWQCCHGEDGKALPRRAGVSSFGLGGSNAHVVLEEYPTVQSPHASNYPSPYLFVLSAKNENRLKAYAARVLSFLKANRQSPASLVDLIYTLQVGREPMPVRLAAVVDNLADVADRLEQYVQGTKEEDKLYTGTAVQLSEPEEFVDQDLESNPLVHSLIGDGNLEELARLWVAGTPVDWDLLYPKGRPRRLSLPTYPFEPSRHWVDLASDPDDDGPSADVASARLHPLIHCNTSTLRTQQYTTELSPKAFYMADHVVAGRTMLPGAAMVEMARAAGELAMGKTIHQVRNLVWAQPVVGPAMDAGHHSSSQVHIRLVPEKDRVRFEIFTTTQEGGQEVNCQGLLVSVDKSHAAANPAEQQKEIDAIRRCCATRLDGAACYKHFESSGVTYGPAFRTLRTIDTCGTEALVRLELPEHLVSGASDYGLHPSLIDGALQAVIGLADQDDLSKGPTWLPFSIEKITLYGPVNQSCYAHVVPAGAQGQPNWQAFDIRLLDEQGNPLAALDGFTMRAMTTGGQSHGSVAASQTLFFHPVWKEIPLPQPEPGKQLSHDLLLLDTDQALFQALESHPRKDPNARIVLVTPAERFKQIEKNVYEVNPAREDDYLLMLEALEREKVRVETAIIRWAGSDRIDTDTLAQRLDHGVGSCFYLVRALMGQASKQALRLLYVYSAQSRGANPLEAGVSGLIRSIRSEYPRLVGQTLALENGERMSPEKLADTLLAAGLDSDPSQVEIFQGRQRYVKSLEEIELPEPTREQLFFKDDGLYLITGGLGGLGRILTEDIVAKAQAQVVLTGRSDLSQESKSWLASLQSDQHKVTYLKADVSDRQAVKTLIADIKSRYGQINGILHSAGTTRDALLINKARKDLDAVLAPKVYGTIYLDEATAAEPLDWFVMFSSTIAVTGNRGQCDYAYANGFMDHFAILRQSLRDEGRRHGKTLSIDWPLWAAGGMQSNEQSRILAERSLGITALETQSGLEAFGRSFGYEGSQLMVLAGRAERIREKLLGSNADAADNLYASPHVGEHPSQDTGADEAQIDRLQHDLSAIASSLMKLKSDEIDPQKDLSIYGFDSISITAFINKINRQFNLELMPPVFYEHPTLHSLATFLLNNHPAVFKNRYSYRSVESSQEQVSHKVDNRFLDEIKPDISLSAGIVPDREPIAVIGMSGVMPGSANLDIFWKHLAQGRDLVTEIPADRWDWQAIYGDAVREVNKTDAKWGGFIDHVDRFDAEFFNISTREAELMDPQQRIFMETVWHTVEDAGYRPSELSGSRVGLFVGVASMDYMSLVQDADMSVEGFGLTGLSPSIVANRISHLMNWHGPSEPVNTACSSSLVALHRAIETIHGGGCELAVAGGINLILTPTLNIMLRKGGMLSPDGRCKTFDKGANGYVRGEGSGAVLLKPLSRAEADGDHIYAVIRCTAVNHSGHANSLTTPNPNAQADLLKRCYSAAQIDPSTVSYIETHGTGTSLGDPAEINGLKSAFEKLYRRQKLPTPKKPHCFLGAVKSCIGHLEAAAGIAGLIKVLLMLKHRVIPGNLHLEDLNPYIELDGTPFSIAENTVPWNCLSDGSGQSVPRRAGVSSFGFGGAYAHAIIEEYPKLVQTAATNSTAPLIFVYSARDQERLNTYAQQMIDFIKSDRAPDDQRQIDDLRPLGSIVEKLQIMAGRILDVNAEKIDPHTDLKALGFDVITLARLHEEIDNRYDTTLKLPLRMEDQTIEALAVQLSKMACADGSDDEPKTNDSLDLQAMAYTLQIGREPMAARLAILAESVEQLHDRLTQFVQRSTEGEGILTGTVREKEHRRTNMLIQGQEGEDYMRQLIANERMDVLARLWVTGVEIPWRLMYVGLSLQRLSLPVYPFARKRYWVPSSEQIHPVVSSNYSAEESAPVENIQMEIKDILGKLLKISTDEIGQDKEFITIGMDSIVATEFVYRLTDRLKVEITPDILLTKNTLRVLSDYLLDKIHAVETPGLIAGQHPEKDDHEFSSKKDMETDKAESIPPVKTSYPLSSGQLDLWAIYKMAPENYAYNLPMARWVKGDLNKDILKQAFKRLIERHSTLRSVIKLVDGHPVQVVNSEINIEFNENLIKKNSKVNPDEFLRKRIREPFDLENGPVIRIDLYSYSKSLHILLVTVHHIFCDGISFIHMLRDFLQFYEAELSGKTAKLPSLTSEYSEFVLWEKQITGGETYRQNDVYWRKKLRGTLPVLDLPTDRQKRKVLTYEGKLHSVMLPKKLTENLKTIAATENAYLFATLLSIYKILLFRLTGQTDIIVGTPLDRRQDKMYENMVGYFLNMTIIKTHFKENWSFRKMLKEVQNNVSETIKHGDYPFGALLNLKNENKEKMDSSLFQVGFTFLQVRKTKTWTVQDSQFESMESIMQEGEFDLSLETFEREDGCIIYFKYNPELFDQETIERFGQSYIELTKSIVNNPDQHISRLDMLADKDKRQLLYEWNNNHCKLDLTKNKLIHNLIEAQAYKNSENIAVVYRDEKLSYGELNRYANILSHHLISLGVDRDQPVAIRMKRGIKMIVAILAVLKSGGAYMPIDSGVDYPKERINHMFAESNTAVLLTESPYLYDHVDNDLKILDVEKVLNQKKIKEEIENPKQQSGRSDLAYVLYTSGSTGKPKGVMITHENVINLFHGLWQICYQYFQEKQNVALVAAFTFDASVQQYLPALSLGHCVHIMPDEVKENSDKVIDFYKNNHISISDGTPAFVEVLTKTNENKLELPIKKFIIGGEAFATLLAKRLYEKNEDMDIINIYGPTECCVDATYYDVPRENIPNSNILPIGKPLANFRIYILDRDLQPVPLGVYGEIYIASPSVGRGYLNNEELTNKTFIEDPFKQNHTMYRTGDIGRWHAKGIIEFRSRRDNQVKIRGYRIECEEIEDCISEIKNIENAVVVAKQDANKVNYLCAYYVASDNVNVEDIKKKIREKLPNYMMPSYFINTDKLPKTSSGKIDRKSLPEPVDLLDKSKKHIAPKTESEKMLTTIWAKVLQIDYKKISIFDDLFEIGGNSLYAIQISYLANQAGLSLKTRDIIENPTIHSLARKKENKKNDVILSNESSSRNEVFGLTPIQSKFIRLGNANPSHFNQYFSMETDQKIDEDLLVRALESIIMHHDALRINLKKDAGEWIQKVGNKINKKILFSYDLTEIADGEKKDKYESIIKDNQNKFDLFKTPLLRVLLFKLSKEKMKIVFIIHHMVTDLVSCRILMEDMDIAYEQISSNKEINLPMPTSSYREWSTKLIEYANKRSFQKELTYWSESKRYEVESIPLDYPGALDRCKENTRKEKRIIFDKEITTYLMSDICPKFKAGINEIILTSAIVGLKSWIGSKKISIDMEGHGREEIDSVLSVSRTVGWFTKIYPVIFDLNNIKTNISSNVKQIKDIVNSIPKKGINYGIIKFLKNQKALHEISNAQICYNYLDTVDNITPNSSIFKNQTINGMSSADDNKMEYLLAITAGIKSRHIFLRLIYSKAVFKSKTIDRLGQNIRKQIEKLD